MPLAAGQIVNADDLRPFTVVARGERNVAFSSTPATNVDVGILRVDGVNLIAGRMYMVHGRFRGTTATATDRSVGRIRWDTTGAAATISSGEVERTELQSTSTSNTINVIGYVFPAANVTASFLLIFMRVGTSAMSLQVEMGQYARLTVIDLGTAVPDTGVDV